MFWECVRDGQVAYVWVLAWGRNEFINSLCLLFLQKHCRPPSVPPQIAMVAIVESSTPFVCCTPLTHCHKGAGTWCTQKPDDVSCFVLKGFLNLKAVFVRLGTQPDRQADTHARTHTTHNVRNRIETIGDNPYLAVPLSIGDGRDRDSDFNLCLYPRCASGVMTQ